MNEERSIDAGFARPGSIRYMNAPTVRRGNRMPVNIKFIIAGIGLAALLIASVFGMRIYDDIANAPARHAESVAAAINGGLDLNLPVLDNFADSDNQAIRDSLSSSGYATIDVDALYARPADDADPASLDLVKYPDDIDHNRAVELFKSNLRRVDVTEAAHFLAGTWRLTSFQSEGVDLKVKYADFTSESIEGAIASAIAAQGWGDSTFGESGVDQSGNTFQNGTIQVNDRNFHWSVSVCPLDEVYNVHGLPEHSFYVGARLVQ